MSRKLGRNRGRIAMLGTAYLDDSADASRNIVFLAAGFFLPDGDLWKHVRRKWRKTLRERGVPYYRSYDWRTLTGGFNGLKEKWGEEKARQIADRLRFHLHNIIEEESEGLNIGYAMGVDLQAHREVDAMTEAQQSRKWMRESHDYQVAGFRHLFCRLSMRYLNHLV